MGKRYGVAQYKKKRKIGEVSGVIYTSLFIERKGDVI